jgi:four helix bundle protein
MNPADLLQRTKNFALTSIKFFQSLPKTDESRIIGKQFLRSSTSLAVNYRAACRARSKQEFYAKLCIVVEESDETLFWLELLIESEIANSDKAKSLMKEAEELLFIFSASKKSTKENLN